MVSLADALVEVVGPAVGAVFADGEVSAISVAFDPALLGGSITLALTAVGEDFADLVVQGDVTGHTADDWQERLRSNLADVISESRFGWGRIEASDDPQSTHAHAALRATTLARHASLRATRITSGMHL